MSIKMVKVRFDARTEVHIGGEMEVPAEMFDRVLPDEEWSSEIERYISEHYTENHIDLSSIDDDLEDFEIERV